MTMLYEVKLTFDFDTGTLTAVSGTVMWPDTMQPEHVHVWSAQDARVTAPSAALDLEARACRNWIRDRGEQLRLALEDGPPPPVSADRWLQSLDETF